MTAPRALSLAAARRIRRASTGFVVFVALAAAVLSFTGLYTLGMEHGLNHWTAPLLPLMTDGAVAAFSLTIVHHDLSGLKTTYPWLCMLLAIAVSIAGNVLSAPEDLIAQLIHAWPPIVFALAFEALTRLLRHRIDHGIPEAVTVATSAPATAPAHAPAELAGAPRTERTDAALAARASVVAPTPSPRPTTAMHRPTDTATRPVDGDVLAEAIELHAQGHSWGALATRFGVSKTSLQRAAAKAETFAAPTPAEPLGLFPLESTEVA